MLVLSRKVGEKLIIGDNVVVEVVRISGNRITLGVVAPSEVKILRGELQVNEVPSNVRGSKQNTGAESMLLKAC